MLLQSKTRSCEIRAIFRVELVVLRNLVDFATRNTFHMDLEVFVSDRVMIKPVLPPTHLAQH